MSAVAFAYLGKPGAMVQLPIPRRGFDKPESLGDSAHSLLSGGSAVVRNLYPKRTYTAPYDVTTAEADVIRAFYLGFYGTAPFRFVDPTERNMLGLDVSSVGLRTAAALGWAASTGSLARASTGGPTGVLSGVLTWTSLAAAATLLPGSATNTADITSAPVYVPTEAVTVSLYAKASSSSSGHTLQLVGFDAAGAVLVSSATAAMALTTSWQRFTVTIAVSAAAYASAVYVAPRVVLGGSVPTSVSIAGAQLEYADAVSSWQPGFGCPQVVILSAPGRGINAPGYRSSTLTLAEV